MQAEAEVLTSDNGLRVVLLWRWHESRRELLDRDADVVRETLAAHPTLADTHTAEARIFHTATARNQRNADTNPDRRRRPPPEAAPIPYRNRATGRRTAMNSYGYSIALFFHLVSLVAAGAAAALSGYAALRLRAATSPAEVTRWGTMIEKVVRIFAPATLGLLASGAYMTQSAWSWSTPWIVAGLVGLAMIILRGSGVEASRGRALKNELQSHDLSERARRLTRDPLAWTARAMEWMLMLGVMFVMTAKPPAWGCATSLVIASLAGVVAAVPIWRRSATHWPAGASASRLRATQFPRTHTSCFSSRHPEKWGPKRRVCSRNEARRCGCWSATPRRRKRWCRREWNPSKGISMIRRRSTQRSGTSRPSCSSARRCRSKSWT